MGLLDDLQVEVKKIRADEFRQNAELGAQEEFYSVHLRPVMLRVYQYLSDIVDNLSIIVPDISPSYPLNPLLKEGVALKQGDYKFSFDNSKTPHQIDIRCSCTLERPQEFHVPTKDAALRYAELLESHKFPHHRKDHRDRKHNIRGATFILEGPMKVHMRIHARAADKCIYIDLRNLEDQPLKRYKFPPEKVDDELLERLARLLIREESRLVEVSIDDDYREELRRRIELDKRRDEEALAEAYAHMEAENQAEKDARLTNRAKRAVVERADGVLKIFQRLK